YDNVDGLSAAPDYEQAKEFIAKSVQDFMDGTIDEVVLVYNGYKNMISQELKQIRLLPIDTIENDSCDYSSQMEFEPENDSSILDAMLQKYVEYNLYFALINSLAGEHSARMQAMDSATKNASELVDDLNLQYNKARQEAITTELSEIVSGAEAMK
ncbi:MAG: F0F1 ATP synthase subunit gamma, partial [Campylobacterales bacterium]|nr:F0F1 ATP synthase subunit gamma [Campylobacterales bacterium]